MLTEDVFMGMNVGDGFVFPAKTSGEFSMFKRIRACQQERKKYDNTKIIYVAGAYFFFLKIIL